MFGYVIDVGAAPSTPSGQFDVDGMSAESSPCTAFDALGRWQLQLNANGLAIQYNDGIQLQAEYQIDDTTAPYDCGLVFNGRQALKTFDFPGTFPATIDIVTSIPLS